MARDMTGGWDRDVISPRLNARYDVARGWRLYGSWGRIYPGAARGRMAARRSADDARSDGHRGPYGAGRGLRGLTIHFVRVSSCIEKRWTHVRPYYDNLLDTLSLVRDLAPDRVRVAPLGSEAGGAELTVRRSLSRGIDLRGSYSASLVPDDFASRDDVRRSWDQPHALSLGLDWTVRSWKASAVFGWHRGWPRTDVAWSENNAGTLLVGARNASRWGNYFTD